MCINAAQLEERHTPLGYYGFPFCGGKWMTFLPKFGGDGFQGEKTYPPNFLHKVKHFVGGMITKSFNSKNGIGLL